VVQTVVGGTPNLGFLTILQESNGYLGGYLVTNSWGRPLEFRVSTAVQPNRVQQILYGGTLQPYICADLIGKTLIDKTSTAVGLIVTDCESALELRAQVEMPVLWLAGERAADVPSSRLVTGMHVGKNEEGSLYCHARFPADAETVREFLQRIDGVLDLGEPFTRIRTAITEARKQGVTSRG
jgi:hypothetical protein